MTKISRKTFIVLGIIGIFFLGKYLFGLKSHGVVPPVKLVEVEAVNTRTFKQTIRLLGTIHPKHTAILIAKETGMLDVLVPTGQKVNKDTLIAKIINPDLDNNLQLSISTEALAKTQFERLNKLLKTGFVSSKEAEEKKQTWLESQKDLSKAKIELDNLRFYAPFNGIVGAYKKREGAQVNAGDIVVAIYDPSALVVDFDVPCGNLPHIKEGQEVTVLGKVYSLNHIQNMLDEDSHMCPADVNITCDDCLIGATVDLDLVVTHKNNTIVVPQQALFLRNSKPFVYVVKDGKVDLVSVKVGLKQQDKVEITQGLTIGQQLIIKGQERLYPGMAVEIFKPKKDSSDNSSS